jgi:hypothetical protein
MDMLEHGKNISEEGHSQTEECRQTDKLEYGKNLSGLGALTN